MTYYFTYGVGDCQGQAFQYGGWTEVEADSIRQALKIFKTAHPPVNGLLPCCSVALTADQMGSMLEEGNGGKFCRERIRETKEGEIEICQVNTRN